MDLDRRTLAALLPVVGLAMALAACGTPAASTGPGGSGGPVSGASTNDPNGTPGGPGPSGVASSPCIVTDVEGVGEARASIDKANLAEETSIEAIENIRFDDAGVVAATQALQDGVTGDALWAATWIYATSGCPVELLAPLLTHDDPTIRLMAAAAHIAWGHAEGIPVMRALLADESHLRGSRPPTSVADFAAGTLASYIDGVAIEGDAEPAAITAAWSQWLAANASTLIYNAETGRWSAP